MQQELWITEKQTQGYTLNWRIEGVLHEEQTSYQHLQVVETTDFGRALVLDGAIQVTEQDEFIYHEMIAHVPLYSHPNPRRVLVIGGGDGGTVREVLRHPEVERVDLVEIDDRVVEVCRRYLPEMGASLDDPRCRVIIADGLSYVADLHDAYDVILVDSSDPVGPAVGLFQRPFYENTHRALSPDGLFVCQSESPVFNSDLLYDISRILTDLYRHSSPYLFCIPTYPSGYWSFSIASKRHDFRRPLPRAVPAGLRYYSPEVHRAAFALPPFVKQMLTTRLPGRMCFGG